MTVQLRPLTFYSPPPLQKGDICLFLSRAHHQKSDKQIAPILSFNLRRFGWKVKIWSQSGDITALTFKPVGSRRLDIDRPPTRSGNYTPEQPTSGMCVTATIIHG